MSADYDFGSKELQSSHGVNRYDFEARYYAPIFGFTTMDPLCEKYYEVSPYSYCAGNPVNAVDLRGDSITILNLGNNGQHMALLIQNSSGKWSYFSVNGDNAYISGKHIEGRTFDDLAVGEFDSPQQFLDSDYNTESNKNDGNTNSYGYQAGYVLPTTQEQDNIIKETFVKYANMDYSLIDNQCSQVVQKALNRANINMKETSIRTIDPQTNMYIQFKVNPYLPSNAFKAIIKNNPNGTYIKK